ncbi:chromatin modification-related protein EAF7-domain-containing protein [Xylaria sp. FL0043]|nr:chromatin modification-related protein EAF7-domain-containing protein [Xylaria sp. FL0043]
MPPKRKSKALAEVSTPKASATPAQDEDAMDVDTPKASETPRAADTPVTAKPNHPPESEILGDLWTEDQTSSLFKAIIRWKPSGMHKHFRIIAISEHLRNHGFDPDVETHTRIPGIWTKLRQFFDMEMIDERDNSFDYVKSLGGDEAPEEIYKDFDLPPDTFHDLMWARAAADENEPDNWTDTDVEMSNNNNNNNSNKGRQSQRKRKRGDTIATDAASVAGSATTARVTRRSSTVEDTDRETPAASSPVSRSARGARSQKRAAAKARTESLAAESDHEDEEEEQEDEDNGEEEEDKEESSEGEEEGEEEEEEEKEEKDEKDEKQKGKAKGKEREEESEAPATRSGRGARGRGGGRGRGRPKGGRKKH